MTYDTTLPGNLKAAQEWFASIITRPIDVNSRMNPISPSGVPMEVEAPLLIAPSPTLKADERIQIYNQQYWWRLYTTMQESYPVLTRLFGYFDFNQAIASPYLVKYPPNHWALGKLGNRLLQWIEEDYTADDKELVYYSALVDGAYAESFLAPSYPPVDLATLPNPEDLSSLLDKTLHLQPHVHLFEMPYDVFLFRVDFLKHDPDYWVENDFPVLKHALEGEKDYFILYRAKTNDICIEKITRGEYLLLQRFITGCSIDVLCQWLEEQQDEKLCEEAGQKLQEWFQHWTSNQLLTLHQG